MDKQQQLEQEALNKSVSRTRKQQRNAIENERETTTTTGSIALSGAIVPLALAIEEWLSEKQAGFNKKYKPFFRLLNSEIVALVIARTVLDGISKGRKRTALAGSIGRAIQQEYQLQEFKKNYRSLFNIKLNELKTESDSMKETILLKELRRQGICSKPWSKEDTIQIGMVSLMLMEKYTGLIKLVESKEGKRIVGRVVPSKDMSEWLETSYAKNSMSSFIYEPMVVKPNDWTNVFDGGYRLKEFQSKGLFVNDKGKHDNLEYKDSPALFDAVNHLQDTGWSVNKEVLDIASELWENNSQAGDLPNREFIPDPSKPLTEEGPEWREYYQRLHAVRYINNTNISKRYKVNDTLEMAHKFKGESMIFFPYHLDFRGRAYPFVKSLSPQGNDLSKGLLQFHVGKSIDTPEQETYFYVHGANMYGIKGTIKERRDWVVENMEWLKKTGDDPRTYISQWSNCNNPFQFLAWVLELSKYERNYLHLSRIPIAMDGSCNGLQIISLLLRDEKIGRSTNCVPQDKPADLYQEVADLVKKKLQSNPNKNNLEVLKYKIIDRDLVKKAVMTVPYGATYYTIQSLYTDKFMSTLTSALAQGGEYTKEHRRMLHHINILSRYTWKAIEELIPTALGFNKWLKEKIRPLVDSNIDISWTTPIGIKVYQGYKVEIRQRITTAIGRKVRRNTHYREELQSLSRSRNNKAILPNYIHSLDASVMLMTTNYMRELGKESLAMVHDSFATHAADAPELAEGLRKIVTEIFSQNLLNLFDNEVTDCYPDSQVTFKSHSVRRGALDINQLKKSLYFFH